VPSLARVARAVRRKGVEVSAACTPATPLIALALQAGKEDEAELSIQNVLEEINKGFKTSAQDDKVGTGGRAARGAHRTPCVCAGACLMIRSPDPALTPGAMRFACRGVCLCVCVCV